MSQLANQLGYQYTICRNAVGLFTGWEMSISLSNPYSDEDVIWEYYE